MRSGFAWPWRRKAATGAAVFGGAPESPLWLHLAGELGKPGALVGGGCLEPGDEPPADFARRLRSLGLPRGATLALLPLADTQLLQIEAPKVAPEELRAAARWHVKDLVHDRLDELTLDVMPVGDGEGAAARHLFVAAARHDVIRQRVELAAKADVELRVIDIVESAQRNLQCALAEAAGLHKRATAMLTQHGEQCLLTICAAGELFFARRLESMQLRPATTVVGRIEALAVDDPFDSAALVDYGAQAADDSDATQDAPRLVLEVQRSFDVWERTWRQHPLARLWVDLGDDTSAWIRQFAPALTCEVEFLDVAKLFPGFETIAPDAASRSALLPLAGALLRRESRSL